MGRFFNIAGPCNPADHYTVPAMARLPEVVSLIRKMVLGTGGLDLGVLSHWDSKIRHGDVSRGDKTVHVFWC